MSLPRVQKLMYIVPAHHEKMGDYFDFLNSCKKACGPSASLGVQKCGADELGPVYLDYIKKCKEDYHGCACEITYMYCGSVPFPRSLPAPLRRAMMRYAVRFCRVYVMCPCV